MLFFTVIYATPLLGWVGWGWDVKVHCTHAQCYASAALGGGMLMFIALAHMLDAC